ncbi:phage portal protein [Streptomyces sp. DSM 44915]|uniref:Phage portal protein n=1 Tax=Streptomyces chisholmiae TaxID=3075540 RepID=A0ABU2K0P7_9ACTN|nr:phage portal protein [Streptomyces sp. DSM 44915]MDT0270576.1 phage portal protein [Streptomyces sp. DSM 44915]
MAWTVSAGQLARVDRDPPPLAPQQVRLSDDVTMDYVDIYRSQPHVRTVVDFLGRNIAQLGLHVFRRVSDTDRERLTDHPLARLLSRPNLYTTRYRLINALVQDIAVYDMAVWARVRPADAGNDVGGLVRLPMDRTKPVGGDWMEPAAFELKGSAGVVTIPRDRVVYFRGYNPSTSALGLSPMETLRGILAEGFSSQTYREQLWRNGARMSGWISRPSEAPAWSDKGRERFRADWRGLYTGDGQMAGGTPILEDGMQWHAGGMTPEQAQYLETRKLTREEVASAYHIPLPMVGILDHATYSNIREQHRQLYQDTLGPWLTWLAEEIELQLLPDLPDSDNVYVEFNIASKMSGSFEEQAAAASTATGGPWMTRNEQRARFNLPQIEGGDELITPLNVTEGGQASPRDSAPPPSAAPEGQASRAGRSKHRRLRVKARAPVEYERRYEETLTRFFERQQRSVMSRAGAAKRRAGVLAKASVSEVFDRDRWVSELSADLYALGLATSVAAATAALDALDADPETYNEDATLEWLAAHAAAVAASVNAATEEQVAAALEQSDDEQPDALSSVFAVALGQRVLSLAQSEATAMSGFGTTEAARGLAAQTGGEATKTWRVRSSNPRPAHRRMDGETVGLDDTFSNGARWPADSRLDPLQRAGCQCDVEVSFDI